MDGSILTAAKHGTKIWGALKRGSAVRELQLQSVWVRRGSPGAEQEGP